MSWGKDTREIFDEQAQHFKAFGHPVRLQILRALAEGEACVCHLETLLAKSQPYISQQLAVLREAGLVNDRREGVIVYYRLADARVAQIPRLMRAMMADQGLSIDHEVPPAAPLPGCSCPRCKGEGVRS